MDQTMLYLLALALYLSTWKSAAVADDDQPFISLPIHGNVYPDGHYNVTIFIGDPPAPYTLDIDTGSDLTWVQCDAPCIHCYPGPHPQYKKLPNFDNIVHSSDPICQSHYSGSPGSEDAQCDYLVKYVDAGSSMGVLVRDNINVTLKNGTMLTQLLAFGCGYDQEYGHNVPLVDGILGLGKGGLSILAQLDHMGVTRNFVGHCFSSAGGGYLLIGSPGLIWAVWKPILVEGDNYLPSLQYEALLDLIVKNVDLEITNEDESLPICWKADQPFTSVGNAATHFKTLLLHFTHGQIVDFELRPESYLIVSDKGNPCLGILNGTDVGLGNTTLIGDISMQDTSVLYDNDNSMVGWAPADCNRLP